MEKKGILGVKSTVKLFSMTGELWPDDSDSMNDDSDFDPGDDGGSNGAPSGRVPKNGEDAASASDSSTEKEESEDEPMPVRTVPRLTIKVPQASTSLQPSVTFSEAMPATKRRGPRPKNANGNSPKKRGKRDKSYYEPETLELQAEAAFVMSDVGPAKYEYLSPLLKLNDRHNNVHYSLPAELLQKIFKHIIDEEPKRTVQELLNLASVCEAWRQIILKSPELWLDVDLSDFNYSNLDEHLKSLCRDSNTLSSVTSLSLSGWSQITEEHLTLFAEAFGSKLKSLNLRDCHNITQSLLPIIQDRFPILDSLDLSRTSYTNTNPAPSVSRKGQKQQNSNPLHPTLFKAYLIAKGKNLSSLSIAENKLQSYTPLITSVLDNCPNLTVLDLSNLESGSKGPLSVDKLSACCPKLKVLRLASVTLQASNRGNSGFPFLEELVIPVQGEAHSVGHSDNILTSLTDKAENLKMLDIRGSRSISVSSLIKIPSWSIEHLSLAYCTKLHCPDLGELALRKWKDSLIDFDLSWNQKSDSVSASLEALADSDNSQLRTLNLRGSAVSMKSVRRLIKNCKQLISIDLQSCRGLPRGVKRAFEGKDFKRFADEVCSGVYDDCE